MHDLDPEPRKLGFLLGLGDLNLSEPCHGYANGCVCAECSDRADAEEHLRWHRANPSVPCPRCVLAVAA